MRVCGRVQSFGSGVWSSGFEFQGVRFKGVIFFSMVRPFLGRIRKYDPDQILH